MAMRRLCTSLIRHKPSVRSPFVIKRHKVTFEDLYEPDYLHELRPQVPVYNAIDIQLKGYDFRVLENFQRFAHRLAENMDIDVEDSWATPLQRFKIQRFRPNSAIVDGEYTLETYERNINLCDVEATTFSTYLRLLETAIPEGVSLQAREFLPEYEEILYVPDKQLLDLKEELGTISGGGKKK